MFQITIEIKPRSSDVGILDIEQVLAPALEALVSEDQWELVELRWEEIDD